MEKVKCPFCGYEMPIRFDKKKQKQREFLLNVKEEIVKKNLK